MKTQDATALSSYLWDNPPPDITWEIIHTTKPYKPGRGNYQQCINEEVQIQMMHNLITQIVCVLIKDKRAKLAVTRQDINWPNL